MDPEVFHRHVNSVTSIVDARIRRDETLDVKWQRFLDLRNRCWEPGATVADGIAAGRAYGDFLRACGGR